ncbi:hypothetical protein NPIL_574131 [Nephila pilipes]|uniref:Uncharacterized protein n=1 Tax=Nephila pilipes TaxID=299642 RepID=A0A8X6P3I4_NEPPI|nr:hypothetical protein NPIL_574131 [Nephila pilipes]
MQFPALSTVLYFMSFGMKAYFAVLVAMCVVLLTLQSVEMSPDANEKNQSDNLITLELPRDILVRLTGGLLRALGNYLGR